MDHSTLGTKSVSRILGALRTERGTGYLWREYGTRSTQRGASLGTWPITLTECFHMINWSSIRKWMKMGFFAMFFLKIGRMTHDRNRWMKLVQLSDEFRIRFSSYLQCIKTICTRRVVRSVDSIRFWTGTAPSTRVFGRMTLKLSHALTDTPSDEDINEHLDMAERARETYNV